MKLIPGRHGRKWRRRRALARFLPRAVLIRIGRRLTVWSLRLAMWGARRALRRMLRALLPGLGLAAS
ncbi:hypothetical protein ADK53_05970 [Streptomyces sp. WM6373]|uniref:hypothetical protein n=1 Tax=Streptomyces TaxID=1883 RepID=UPI0006AF4BE1|nr:MULTISPECIES: hypothetical protein [unclassified Streptomyces]KOU43364.1 hypothetical protein ADK53_05970 [Streptomyces sp. WM6373]KOU72683.1 hypothetical protein ADK61_25760 [Streptomyces sp. XY66]KOU76372.1 hypothetical protein ADK96_02100 [Streptomyces sp. IGB124]KOU88619.1 hypothetical protein ADK93_12990 [Streptomyces sp. XY58]KOV12905.1 hypothetical protein ADK89_01640 [Streptomyces sp. XY37]